MRVVSLLPSATEMVHLLAQHCADGDPPQLVGLSHECDFPPAVAAAGLPQLTAAKTTFTDSLDVDRQVRAALASGQGLYTVDGARLAALAPDAIVTQSLCAVCSVDYCLVADIAAGLHPRPLVVDLNPASLQDVLADLPRLGAALGCPAAGDAAAARLRARVGAAEAAAAAEQLRRGGAARPSVAFLEWVAPLFVGGHWTPQLIRMAGGDHPLNPPKDGGGAGKSFVASAEQLAASAPDWVVVAPCGLDLATARRELQAHLAEQAWWRELPAVRAGRVAIVDGNQMFNRPGPRLVDALEFLVGLLHNRPELIPAGFPYEMWRPAS